MGAKTLNTLTQIRENRHSGGLGWVRVCLLTLSQGITQRLTQLGFGIRRMEFLGIGIV